MDHRVRGEGQDDRAAVLQDVPAAGAQDGDRRGHAEHQGKDSMRVYCMYIYVLSSFQSLPNDRTETYLKCIRESVEAKTQLVVTIFPQQRSDRYAAIKKLCYVERPVASQVRRRGL